MAFQLRTITFDHDVTQAATSALNIRRNKDFEVLIPEFDASQPRPATQQCAAYALDATHTHAVFVRCTFARAVGDGASWDVRATGGGVMGQLGAQDVNFADAAMSASADVMLSHRAFNAVGRHVITWQWEYRHKGSKRWHALTPTSHCIYLLLSVPPAPWSQTFADRHNPWTELLDHSCVIASGKSNQIGAAIAHVKAINANYALRYDIVHGAHRYGFRITGNAFEMTNWIEYVLNQNLPGSPIFCMGSGEAYRNYQIVNCYDCAAGLALMSKSVGASLDYYFHRPFGYLNYVIPIGRGKCNNPFYGCTSNDPTRGVDDDTRSRFGNHAYTKLAGRNNFDACMKRWLSWIEELVLSVIMFIVWLLLLIFSLGSINRMDLLERAYGWLVNLAQPNYNNVTIDTSTVAEVSAASGGHPVAQVLDIRVT